MDSETPIENALSGVGTVETPTPAPADKKSKGPVLGMALLAILALAGIGFGIYMFMDSNKKADEIKDLKSKISTLEQGASTNEAESGDYIYIAEWGLKIAKPSTDELREFSYAVSHNTLYLWGAKPAEGAQATSAFGYISDWNGKIANYTFLGRVTKDEGFVASYCEEQSTCGLVIEELEDGTTLRWHDPDTALEVYADQQDYDGQLQESISILKTHFTNVDNYYEF